MPNVIRKMLENGYSYDEPDRIPKNITITNFDIIMYVVAIVGHLVDLGLDVNVAVRYFLSQMMMEFGWTLTFILLPAFVNTAVSIRMYSQDKQQDSVTNEFTKRHWLRIFILVLQLAPILRFIDSLIYAIKSRKAARNRDPSSQRMYYALMLKEDSDAALLRIFECFLEAAPQQVLQTSLLFRAYDHLAVSRVISLSTIAYLYPYWSVLACSIHILIMSTWLLFKDRSPFCSHNKIAEIAFAFALGGVYLFTYILPIEGRTRYRYSIYYSLCFLQNVACALIWYFFAHEVRSSVFFHPVLVLCIVPYVMGLLCMVIYYLFFHPKVSNKGEGIAVSLRNTEEVTEVVS